MNEHCRGFRIAWLTCETPQTPDSHLRSCSECRAFVDAERQATQLIRSLAWKWEPPVQLRERVAATLARERSRRRRVIPRRVALAAAAVAVAMAGTTLAWMRSSDASGHERAHQTTALIAEDFLKFASKGPEKLQVASRDPAVVERFFAEHLRLAAKVPRLRDLTVVGGRRCDVGGRPAALIFLERELPAGPEPYALFVFEPDGEDWSTMPELPTLRGRRACHQSKRGVGIILWEERGLVYALAGAEEIERLSGVVEAAL
jgi:hypothetical protein